MLTDRKKKTIKMQINIMKKILNTDIFHPKRTTTVFPYLFICLEEGHYPRIKSTGSPGWTVTLVILMWDSLLNILSLISSIVNENKKSIYNIKKFKRKTIF